MKISKIISPCISICKNDPKTDLCFGCARTDEEKNLEKSKTTNEWKKNNLITLQGRMKESQLITFKKSYDEKIQFGKLVYSKNLKNKPQYNPTIANNIISKF